MPIKKEMPNKEELYNLYIEQNYSLKQLQEYYSIGETLLLSWLRKNNIKKSRKIVKIPPKEELENFVFNKEYTQKVTLKPL